MAVGMGLRARTHACVCARVCVCVCIVPAVSESFQSRRSSGRSEWQACQQWYNATNIAGLSLTRFAHCNAVHCASKRH